MIIDISTPISSDTPIWPGSPKPQFSLISSIKDGGIANDTKIDASVHTGAHIDAPLHFLAKGKSIDQIDLDIFIGPVFVAYLPKVKKITDKDIKKLNIPKGVTRLLFKTSNSLLWTQGVTSFKKDFVGLTVDAAELIVEYGIKLVGIDYLSIASFSETVSVHKILLSNKVAILEGLNLNNVKSRIYQLVAFPIVISGAEAAPVRAVLIK